MTNIQALTKKIIAFRNERDWEKFHNPKDVSMSLVLEATELMEHFQWKNENEMHEYIKINKDEISNELADVFYWALLMSHDLQINLSDALEKKLVINEKKYPIEKSKGNHEKYTKL